MLLIEYRIKLPLSFDEYHVAQLHTTLEMSKELTSPGEGVQILENTPCDTACVPNKVVRKLVSKVQRTLKRYYIPTTVSAPVGLSGCILSESSFNCFPNFRTVIEAGANGEVTIDTVCKKMDDTNNPNIFKLPIQLPMVDIDIVNDSLPSNLLNDNDDPKKVLGLKDDWQQSLTHSNSMVVHKLILVKSREAKKETETAVNTFVADSLRNLFTVFHRKMVCSQDRWKGLTIEDIRTMEQEAIEVLDRKRKM